MLKIESTQHHQHAVQKVCTKCGSTDVRLDAWAVWNTDTQQWELEQTFDQAYCNGCEGDTSIEDEAIEPENLDHLIAALEPASRWSYGGKTYEVNSHMLGNRIQDPLTGVWRPAVRYISVPDIGLVFYRADTEFLRKFKQV